MLDFRAFRKSKTLIILKQCYLQSGFQSRSMEKATRILNFLNLKKMESLFFE